MYTPNFETGGLLMPELFSRIVASILTYEVVVVCVLAMKGSKEFAPLVLPLIITTIAFLIYVKVRCCGPCPQRKTRLNLGAPVCRANFSCASRRWRSTRCRSP